MPQQLQEKSNKTSITTTIRLKLSNERSLDHKERKAIGDFEATEDHKGPRVAMVTTLSNERSPDHEERKAIGDFEATEDSKETQAAT